MRELFVGNKELKGKTERIIEIARQEINKAKERVKKNYNRFCRTAEFRPGDFVWLTLVCMFHMRDPMKIMVLALQGLSEGSQLKQFEQLPNFFFEDLGETRLFHEDWKLVSYVDLGENLVIERNINTAISKMSLTDRKRLYASLEYKYNEKRKRGIFNFIGDISKTLFGTMSESDAEYYSSEIDKVYADNKKLVTLVQNQTRILKLTIQNTENLARDLKRKMVEFDNVTSILNKNLNKIESAIKNNREVIEPIEITEYLEICISKYDQTINMSSRICKRQHPKYYVVAQDPCLNIVMSTPYKDQSSYCKYALIDIGRTGWIQLLDDHRWIFIAPVAETIHVHCKGKTKECLIEKVGLLTLEPGCLAITPDTTLQSDQTIETLPARHYESPFSYKFNSSAFREPAFKFDLIRIPKLSQIHANPSMLRNVGKELDEIIQEAENISKHERTMTSLEKILWLKYAGLELVGLIIFYVSLKFKIVQTIAHWFIRKPCTMIFNNCFNTNGQNVCGQETVNREVYFHNKPSREFATIEVPSKTDRKDKGMRRYISPVLDDLV
ncbi:hypothetical protein M0802_007329 [Mischocyttarus mexicanus]|nr:hypothetical protein M0802_007329 [Mischocyttarus mexicanus]